MTSQETRAHRMKYTLGYFKNLAKSRGGRCLAETYINIKIPLNWECINKHRWSTTPEVISRGNWCPFCANINKGKKKRIGLEATIALGKSKGFNLLSDEYINNQYKYKWKCEKCNGIFFYSYSAIKKFIINSACKHIIRNDIKMMQEFALKRGGICISKVYNGTHKNLIWECSKEHKWEATPANIKNNNTWCPNCVGKNKSIVDLMNIAKNHNLTLISEKYNGMSFIYSWKCSEGHEFKKSANDILRSSCFNRSLCRECRGNGWIMEPLCRIIFEQIYKNGFPKIKPKFLKTESGNLELDGYCEKLKMAFEYDGSQHDHISYYTKTNEELKAIRKRDRIKNRVCKMKDISLVRIKETQLNKCDADDMLDTIYEIIKKKDVKIPPKPIWNLKTIFEGLKNNKMYMKKIEDKCKEKGWTVISKLYLGAKIKLKFRCNKGHTVKLCPNHLLDNIGCRTCAPNKKLDSNYVLSKCKQFGQVLLEPYKNSITSHLMKCLICGIQRKRRISHILDGRGCINCKGLLITVNDFTLIAKNDGGELLSDTYKNQNTVLEFRCKLGHVIRCRADYVRRIQRIPCGNCTRK